MNAHLPNRPKMPAREIFWLAVSWVMLAVMAGLIILGVVTLITR